ncbi:hypothetical protein GCM10022214_77840 [Actinomadura miaoliensis]|uniref:Mutator family transposase n=1 Tax=Actinomadura miaoliensis TaxID=430685 RepID=A0ABP7X0Q8_9ACTN
MALLFWPAPATMVACRRCGGLRPVPRKHRAAVAAELRKIYTAPDTDAALDALASFAGTDLGRRSPQAVRAWEAAWERFIPFLGSPRPSASCSTPPTASSR